MSQQAADLTDAQAQALKVLWDQGGEIVQAGQVAQARDTSDKAARRLLKRMAPEYVAVKNHPQGNIYSLTDTGRSLAKEMFQDDPYGGGNVPTDVPSLGDGGEKKRLHGFTVQAEIQDSGSLPDDWMAVIQEREDVDFLKADENDYILARDTWVVRFHKDAVTFQLRDGCSIYGGSSKEVLRKAHVKARDVAQWVEQVAGIDVQLARYVITRSELAFEEHPLAELADELPGVPLDRFTVMDRDIGKEVLAMDKSPGLPELESKSGEQAERVAQNIERELEEYARHPEAVEFRHSFEREAAVQGMGGQEAVHQLRQVGEAVEQMGQAQAQVSQVKDQLSELSEKQQQLLQVKKEERKTRESLMELVRSNAQAIRQISESVSEDPDDGGDPGGGQQAASSGEGYDDPVQEIYMEYWQDDEWGRPFFRDAADGGEHLCCFKADGSDYKVILESREIELLRKSGQ